MSPFKHPAAIAVDALIVNWENWEYISLPNSDSAAGSVISNGEDQSQNVTYNETTPTELDFSGFTEEITAALPDSTTKANDQADLGESPRNKIITMDRFSLLKEIYTAKHGQNIGPIMVEAYRKSTIKQQEIAWKKLQGWLKNNP